MCIDLHQIGFVGNLHLQPIKGRGSAATRKFLAPPYYSQHAVFASLWALFSYLLLLIIQSVSSLVSGRRLELVTTTAATAIATTTTTSTAFGYCLTGLFPAVTPGQTMSAIGLPKKDLWGLLVCELLRVTWPACHPTAVKTLPKENVLCLRPPRVRALSVDGRRLCLSVCMSHVWP